MDIYDIRRELSMGKSIYEVPLRVTFYARVSTDKEDQIHSYKNQISYYEEKIKKDSQWTFIDGYMDEGITGTSINKRQDFNRMINDAKDKKFDLILTKDICRFARNTVDTLVTTRELLKWGIGVIFELDNINTLSSEGELRLTIMASLAQDESRKISERVKFGFEKSIKNGVVLGNNRIWGYKKDNGKLVIVPEEAKIVKRIFEIYSNNDIGIRNIGKELAKENIYTKQGKEFAFSTIKNIINNPKYKGFYVGRKTTVIDFISKQRKYFDNNEWKIYKDEKGDVPQIIDENLWNKCNSIYKIRSEKIKKKETSYNTKYGYSGKIFCKNDGQAYWRIVSKNKIEGWQCSKYRKEGARGCPNNKIIYTKNIDTIVKNIFCKIIPSRDKYIDDLIELYSKNNSNIKNEESNYINYEIKELNQEKRNLIKLYTLEKINDKEFEEINSELTNKISLLENQVKKYIPNKGLNIINEKNKSNKRNQRNPISKNINNIDNNIKELRDFFNKCLKFEDSFPKGIINILISKIEVSEQNGIKLDIYLNNGTKIPSVCYMPYI